MLPSQLKLVAQWKLSMWRLSEAGRLDRLARHFAPPRDCGRSDRARKISARESLRRLLKSGVLAGPANDSELAEQVRDSPHAALDGVEFIAIGGQKLRLDLALDERERDRDQTQSFRRSPAKSRARTGRANSRRSDGGCGPSKLAIAIGRSTSSGKCCSRASWSAPTDGIQPSRGFAICCRARARASRVASAHSVAARFWKSHRAAILARRLFWSGTGERSGTESLPGRNAADDFVTREPGPSGNFESAS